MKNTEVISDSLEGVRTDPQEHPAKMPIFPVGSCFNEGPRFTDGPRRGLAFTSYIEDGQFAVVGNNLFPLQVSTRYAHHYDADKEVYLYDGTVFPSLAAAGHAFTEAYNQVEPQPGQATLIHPNGKLTRYQPLLETRNQFSQLDMCRAILCEPTQIVVHELLIGPFQGYSMVRAADGGVLCPLKEMRYFPKYPLNSVASAIWLQSFGPDEVDSAGVQYAIQFLYGPVLLLKSELVANK